MIDKKLNRKLNAFLTLNERKSEGIPIAVKDNFLTKDLRTTAGSFVLKNYIPAYSSTVVKRLESAGYFVIGKTNLDSWCHGSSTETSDFGPTKNPWDPTRIPGGSSGGSASAVSSGMVDVAIGSETAGSIRGPASWCGVVGVKPTYGRVSRYGVIAMGSSLDCPGVLAKDTVLASKVLKVISGKDELDATSSDFPVDDYELFLTGNMKGLKVGILKNYMLEAMDSGVVSIISDAYKKLELLGAYVGETESIDPSYAIGVYTVVQRSEVSSNLARYDGIRYGNDRSNFNQEGKRRIMLGSFTLSAGYQDKYYKKAQKVRTAYINDFENLFNKYDVLVAPTMPGIAPKLGESKDHPMFGEMADILAEPSSIAGLPAVSVPCGFYKGMPIGLQIIGKYFDEKTILNVAYTYEQNTDWSKKKPKI